MRQPYSMRVAGFDRRDYSITYTFTVSCELVFFAILAQ